MATLNRIRYSNKVLSRKELNKALAVDPSYIRACEDIERARAGIREAEQELTDISNETAKALPEEVKCSRIERAVTNVAQRLKELREQRTKARSAAFRARRKANRDANALRASANNRLAQSQARLREYYDRAERRKTTLFREIYQNNKQHLIEKAKNG